MKKAFIPVVVLSMLLLFGCGNSSQTKSDDQGFDDQVSDTAQTTSSGDTSTSTTGSSDQTGSSASSKSTGKALLDFTALDQAPELPTGCEITSLAAALDFYGYPADKCDLADNYLEKGEVGTVDPRVAFVGDPRDENSFGCYAPVLTAAANRYLSAQGASLQAVDITGTSFKDLFSYVDSGDPVIVWATRYMEQGHYNVTWDLPDGTSFTWFTPEHCLVLVGYDEQTSLVYAADPLEGAVVTYDLDTFESRYDDLGEQAIIFR